MKIPAFWSKATAEEVNSDGKTALFSCWRWSDTSREDAHQLALTAATSVLKRFLSGTERNHYGYCREVLREEVKQRFTNADGELIAAITQNTYGSLVLSTARVMFIDIDFPAIGPGESFRYFLAKWFNKAAPSPDAQREQAAGRNLEQFLSDNPQWGVRVYRTLAGLRVIATHALFDPAAASTQSLFESLGADPLYMRLCKTQDCFRARLTPKPWRCGHTSNTIGWPRESDDQQKRFEQWQSTYLELQSKYATCRLLDTIGDEPTHPDVKTVIDIHDQTTRCNEALKLA